MKLFMIEVQELPGTAEQGENPGASSSLQQEFNEDYTIRYQ